MKQNKEEEAANGGQPPDPSTVIRLPFIVINASSDTDIDCSIASDKREYLFNLDKPFQVRTPSVVLNYLKLTFGSSVNELMNAVKMLIHVILVFFFY